MAVKTDMLPALLWILHAGDADLKHIASITRTDITEGASNDFHDDGLFSTRIFGVVGSEERDMVYGKIDLKVEILHPKIYRDLMSLRELYRGILLGGAMATFNEETKDFDPNPEGETGYSFFMQHLPKLVLKRNQSPARNERINFIERWRHRMTMKNLIVMPAGMRDVEMGEDGRITKSEINDFYYKALAVSNGITVSSNMNSPAYDTVRKVLTETVYEIYMYLEKMVGGKGGFLKDKWASRRVREGTRNVLTSMNTSGSHLNAPNVPGFDCTTQGMYQTAVSLAPLVIHWLRRGFLSKIMSAGEGDVPLTDQKTLRPRYVALGPYERDRWTTEDGLREVINTLTDIAARHRAVVIGECYLALVYNGVINGELVFRVFDDIEQLPAGLSQADVHPMTLMELIYLSGYSKWVTKYTNIVRYPISGDDSTYPSRIYVKTTSVGEIRRELDANWTPLDGDEFLVTEYPKQGLTTYHDSESPHPSRLKGLGADFDGDTGSSTAVMIKESNEEIERYLGTRAAWVTPSGKMRASVSYDTSDLVVRNLTSRFDHVKQPTLTVGQKAGN